MPNGNQQRDAQQGPSAARYYTQRFGRGIINRLIERIFYRWGSKRQPQIYEGKAETADIRRELEAYFKLNQSLIGQLRIIEKDWNELGDMIWKEADPNSLVSLYKHVSYLTDAKIAEEEAGIFRAGTNVEDDQISIDMGPNVPLIPIDWKKIGSRTLIYIEPDGEVIQEELSIIGYNNNEQFKGIWQQVYDNWSTILQQDPNLSTVLSGIVERMTVLNKDISTHINTIDERERTFHSEKLGPNVNLTKDIAAKRGTIKGKIPKNVRFKHTYKIIAPAILIDFEQRRKKVNNNLEVIEDSVSNKVLIHFNPIKNHFEDELNDINVRIQTLSGDTTTLNREVIDYTNQINQMKPQWNRLSKLTETKARHLELYDDPRRPKSLAELLDALKNISDTTFMHHVGVGYNHFSNWIRDVFNDPQLAMLIFNSGTRDSMIRILESIFSRYNNIIDTKMKLNERFELLSSHDYLTRLIDYYNRNLRINPNFKRDDEVEAGLDENGYSLEVEKVNNLQDLRAVKETESGIWIILLDKWWSEIASNEWQKKLITSDNQFEYPDRSGIIYEGGKGNKGGSEIWAVKVINGVGEQPPFNIRVVPDLFVKDLDLLDTAVYIYNEYDAYRDDLRDGRYHKWGKTTTDYIIAQEGISTEDYLTFGSMPYLRRSDSMHIPKDPITFDFYPMRDYSIATPDYFLNVPNDEKRITRNFHMKCNVDLPNNLRTDGLPNNILSDVRQPTHLNPAFDRSAINARSHESDDRFYIHWGRMYYYEDSNGINKWSENPYPHISTRGIAKWIIYRILMDLPWEIAKETAKNNDGYDYGIRRPLVEGEFIKDPLGATDLISRENPLGS